MTTRVKHNGALARPGTAPRSPEPIGQLRDAGEGEWTEPEQGSSLSVADAEPFDTSDAAAGCEFVDDRIRLRE